MSRAEDRLRRAAERLPPEAGPADAASLGRAVERVEEALRAPVAGEDPEVVTGRGELARTPVELVTAALSRARPVAEGGAYVAILGDEAMAAARAMEREGRSPPLRGMPLAVKDLIAVAGQPLRAGSASRTDAAPEPVDAAVVHRLRAMGAIPIGLTALHEFAFGVTGVNVHTGTPRNPADTGRIPGGSSSGSAVAVAEGSAVAALGTDTGGSVRIPAALCGVVGFKPRYGAYPTNGVFPLAPSLDHVGFLARSIAVVQALHRSLGYPAQGSRPPPRVGLLEEELADAEPEVAEAVAAAVKLLEREGIPVTGVTWPRGDDVAPISTAIMFSEATAIHRADLARDAGRYGQDVRERLIMGEALSSGARVTAMHAQREIREAVRRVLSEVPIVIGPTVPVTAPRIEDAADPSLPGTLVRSTRLGNLAGVPSLSLPAPGDGLPVGIQLTANDDALLLAVGRYVERRLREGG